ncbi:MAG TPA: phosphate ABC transporter permease subunit PstC [Acidimicrobiales bacterium]|jgi:phosphate transport system permease protein|nr:phosphate ABC transporter permease subunit PstC [Acidimicrobiales bacterium]
MTVAGGTAGELSAVPPAPTRVRPPGRAGIGQRLRRTLRSSETGAWRWAGRIAVVLPLAALVFVLTVLVVKAFPAIRVNGWNFLTTTAWNAGSGYGGTTYTDGVAHPIGSDYGAWAFIAGTLESSVIAVVIALPISVGCAFALTERLPRWVSRPLGFAVELLAGIPSVVIGLWGILTFGPVLARDVYPIVADHVPDVPVLRYFGNPVGHGAGLLTAGLILALMIVPIITATTRDLFLQVPPLPKEGGEALGMTDWEVAGRITVPWVRSGIVGATVLGLGRALGETIAVAMVAGSITQVAPNVYSPMSTIAAAIVDKLQGAQTDGTGFAVATIAELGLVLAVISVLVNLASRLIIRRTARLGAPVGRGA